MFKKKDFVILSIIILIILGGVIFNHFYFYQNGTYVQIKVNNKIYQTVPLNIDQTIEINNKNTVVIKNDSVFVINSTCPDKLCQKQGAISKNGQQIICLPNKVIVEIISNQNNEIDAVSS